MACDSRSRFSLSCRRVPAPWRRQGVDLRAALVLGGPPLGADPALLLQLVQGGIERAVAHLQRVLGHLSQALADGPLNASAHKNLGDNANMPARPVQISMDAELLRRIDADPEVRERGRSAFVRSAVETYLRARRRQEIDAQIAAAYDGRADEVLEDVSDLIGEQEWPPE